MAHDVIVITFLRQRVPWSVCACWYQEVHFHGWSLISTSRSPGQAVFAVTLQNCNGIDKHEILLWDCYLSDWGPGGLAFSQTIRCGCIFHRDWGSWCVWNLQRHVTVFGGMACTHVHQYMHGPSGSYGNDVNNLISCKRSKIFIDLRCQII